MNKKSPVRHKPEKIKDALLRLQSGRPLSDVAKEIGISKGLLSYWKSHAEQLIPPEKPSGARSKKDLRSQSFINQCWTSINLAFRRLQKELKEEKPAGIRDLALAIAVLADKMGQATQNLQSQVGHTTAKWSVSEDTWMILKRHREAKMNTPQENNSVKPGLGASPVEPEKKDADAVVIEGTTPAVDGQTAQLNRDGGN